VAAKRTERLGFVGRRVRQGLTASAAGFLGPRCLWIGGTDRTGFSRGMGQGVASLRAGGGLRTGERAVTLAAIVVAYLSVQPENQVRTRCGLSPPLTDTSTAFVHFLGWGTILRWSHALSCRQEPGLRVRQSTGACTPSMSAAANVAAGPSLPHHCRSGALSVTAAVERPYPDQLALIGGGWREGKGASDAEAKLAGEVRRVNIVQASLSCNSAIMY